MSTIFNSNGLTLFKYLRFTMREKRKSISVDYFFQDFFLKLDFNGHILLEKYFVMIQKCLL